MGRKKLQVPQIDEGVPTEVDENIALAIKQLKAQLTTAQIKKIEQSLDKNKKNIVDEYKNEFLTKVFSVLQKIKEILNDDNIITPKNREVIYKAISETVIELDNV